MITAVVTRVIIVVSWIDQLSDKGSDQWSVRGVILGVTSWSVPWSNKGSDPDIDQWKMTYGVIGWSD